MSPVAQLLTISRPDFFALRVLATSCTNNFSESLGLRNKVLQKIEELRMTMISVSVPDEFLCPITRELMNDPVIATGMSLYDMD